MMQDNIARLLGRCDILGALDWDERVRIAGLARLVQEPRDATIFFQGAEPDALYVVRQGRVRVSTHTADGQELALATLGPGSVFGEIALLDGAPRTATVEAITDVELVRIPRPAFLDLVRARPALAIDVIRVLCLRVRVTGDRMAEGLLSSAEARLVRHLLRLVELFGVPGERGTRIDGRFTQAELGAAVGLSRQTVNRVLRTLEDDGVLVLRRARLEVLDTARLEAWRPS